MKRSILAISAGLAAVLILQFSFSASAKGKIAGVSDTEIVLGASVPLSGPAAIWGNLAKGMEAYAKHVNDQGGIHGRKIRLVIKDDAYNPGRAVANVREMSDEVFAVVGLLGTAVVSAARDHLIEKGIPLVSPYGNVRMWKDMPAEKMKGVFVVYPDYQHEGAYFAKFAQEILKAKTVSVFYQNDDYGKTGLEGVKEGLNGLTGIALSAEVPYEVGAGEVSAQAQKLKEAGAEAVILYPTPKHGAMILKEMAKLGYKPKIVASFPLGDPIMFQLAGDAWEGAHVSLGGRFPGLSPEADKAFEVALKVNPELKPYPNFTIFGVNSLLLAIEGIQRAGKDLTREKFIQSMEGIQNWSAGGIFPVTFGPKRRHGMNTIGLAKAEGGKYVLVQEKIDFPPLF